MQEVETYRYDEINVAASQFPFTNTENPPVRRKRMHATNATQDE